MEYYQASGYNQTEYQRQERCMLISVIVPMYNEAPMVEECLRKVVDAPLPAGIDREIIVVDDGSRDGSAALVEKLGFASVKLIRHAHNRGKGAAIKCALQAVTGEIIIIQDADLEYDPAEYPKLLAPILSGNADVVYGSRFVSGGSRRVHLFRHYLANVILTFMSNWFSNYNLSDIETCYKVFTAGMGKKMALRENGFGIEVELTQKFARLNARMYEVGISYHGRDFSEGKKIRPLRDGLITLICILKYGTGLR